MIKVKTDLDRQREFARKVRIAENIALEKKLDKIAAYLALNQPVAEEKPKLVQINQELDDEDNEINEEYHHQDPKPDTVDGFMVFPTHKDVVDFFKAKAEQGDNFIHQVFDLDTKNYNQYICACGTGTLYQGSLETIKNQLQDDLAQAKNENQELKIQQLGAMLDNVNLRLETPTPASALKNMGKLPSSINQVAVFDLPAKATDAIQDLNTPTQDKTQEPPKIG